MHKILATAQQLGPNLRLSFASSAIPPKPLPPSAVVKVYCLSLLYLIRKTRKQEFPPSSKAAQDLLQLRQTDISRHIPGDIMGPERKRTDTVFFL